MELLATAMQELLGDDLPDDTEFLSENIAEGQSKQVDNRRLVFRRWLYALAAGIILLTVLNFFFKSFGSQSLRSGDATTEVIILSEQTSTPTIIPTETNKPPTATATITPTPIGGAKQVAYINSDSGQVNIQAISGSDQMQDKVIDNSAISLTSLWSSPNFKKIAWESSSGLKIYDSQTKSSQSFPIHGISNVIWHDNSEEITFETNVGYSWEPDYGVLTLGANKNNIIDYLSCMKLDKSQIYLEAVSPDGETISFVEYIKNGNAITERLFSVSVDCSETHLLFETNRDDKYCFGNCGLKGESPFQGVSWSSNSQQLVVSLYGNLFVLDKTGENKSALAGWTTEKAVFPLWLPDSSLIYYLIEDSLIEINADTKEKETIGDFNDPRSMVLSPNMDYILIVDTEGYSNQQLWIYKVMDNELVHLSNALPSDTGDPADRAYVRNFIPSWSPDGKWIAYLSDDKTELINVDDGSYFTLTGNPYSGFLGYDLAWLK